MLSPQAGLTYDMQLSRGKVDRGAAPGNSNETSSPSAKRRCLHHNEAARRLSRTPICHRDSRADGQYMKTHILVGFFSVFALLSACGLPPEAVATQTAIANTAIASAWTSAPSPTVTLTHTATLTPTPAYTPTPTSTPTPTEQLDQAEQKWAEQGITSYRIEVLVVSIWHAQSH